MEKKICKIKIGNIRGTGFFCKIPFPNKENILNVLITANHIINDKLLKEEDGKISIKIKEETEKTIINLNNRIKYTNEEYDITIIEIKEEDNINNFLELDDIIFDSFNNNNQEVNFENKTIYIIQYPQGNLFVSYGIFEHIYEDKKNFFRHKAQHMKEVLVLQY